jgi:hypothetical protein
MFLTDKPYLSPFLQKTIKANNYKIVATKAAKTLIKDDSLNWISEEKAISTLKNQPQTRLYSNSENALAWIETHWGDSELAQQIKVLKDKLQFRELIKDLFPDFGFKKIKLEDIQSLSAEDVSYPLVIKPAVGFFSIGVHIVQDAADWEQAKRELKAEKLQSIFPKNVLDTTYFIIEEFIEGEEFAIDYYYDSEGKVVVLNVLHHIFSSGKDTSDRVYSTSKEIITQYKTELEVFLTKIGKPLNLRNFPAHAEVRIDKQGKIVPIEINPLRFGGFCTTGDVLGVTLDFNSYQCFFENRKPDWDKIFAGKEDKIFSIVILDNSTGIAAADILSFDYDALAAGFEKPVLVRKLDIKKYPVFGFVFTESSVDNRGELEEILVSDLREFINIQ